MHSASVEAKTVTLVVFSAPVDFTPPHSVRSPTVSTKSETWSTRPSEYQKHRNDAIDQANSAIPPSAQRASERRLLLEGLFETAGPTTPLFVFHTTITIMPAKRTARSPIGNEPKRPSTRASTSTLHKTTHIGPHTSLVYNPE